MQFDIVRTLRTASSERFLLQQSGQDVAALDLHYRTNGAVDGTLILFEGSPFKEEHVPQLLADLDERLLPEVSIGDGNLSFTVVIGKVLGAFVAGEK